MAKGTCTTLGCGRVELCKGLCSRCYGNARYRRQQDAKPKRIARCLHCDVEFEQYNGLHVYCKDECRDAEKHARRRARRRVGKSLRCDYCGASTAHRRSDARYCSPECSNRGEYLARRDEIKASVAAWRRANREAANGYGRAYYRRNRKKVLAKAVAGVEGRRPYMRAYGQRWRAENRERTRNYKHARRMREYGNPDSIGVPLREWLRLANRYGGRCAYCDAKPDVLHMDHVVPLARGGRHAIGNVLPACPPCNQTKAARFVVEWRHGRSALRSAA